MSMQQGEMRQNRAREVIADRMPPPSAGALSRIATKHTADKRRREAAAQRRAEIIEATALGVAVVVKPTIDTTWSADEDAVVRTLFPHYAQAVARLPHRSLGAVQSRAAVLGLVPPRKLWTGPEVATLRRLWDKATLIELAAALPRWGENAIGVKARSIGLKPRGRPPLLLTGDPLCDAIRDRCRVLGISMAELDRIATAGTYFSAHEWKFKAGHRLTPMIRAVRALGGVLRVEFPD